MEIPNSTICLIKFCSLLLMLLFEISSVLFLNCCLFKSMYQIMEQLRSFEVTNIHNSRYKVVLSFLTGKIIFTK